MTFMQQLASILMLLGGLGVFLFGLSIMSDSLEKFSGNKLRILFEKLTSNKIKGVLVGAGATGVIQSSSATTVIVVGLINAGLISLTQATSVIMGANIGTTVTALLMSLPITEFIAAFGCIASFVMIFSKKDSVKKIANIVIGFALIFIGLKIMSDSMEPFTEFFSAFFTLTKDPMLLLLVGLLFTAVIQSSSAATGILLSLASLTVNGSPVMTIEAAMFILLGVNIGTCITALLASIGKNANARRAALIHILFNVIGAFLFYVLLVIPPIKNGVIHALELIKEPKMQIAVFHIVFNVATTLLLLPCCSLLVKAATKIIRDDKVHEDPYAPRLKYLSDTVTSAPSVAVAQVKKEVLGMAELAKQNFDTALAAIMTKDLSQKEDFEKREKYINFLNRNITEYLVKLSVLDLTLRDEIILGSYYHVVSDIERIGDYSENIIGYTDKMLADSINFSDQAIMEIDDMFGKVNMLYSYILKCFNEENLSYLGQIEEIENSVDECKKVLSAAHIKRLNEGICSAENGAIFFSLISDVERMADHMTNVSHSVKDYAKKATRGGGRAKNKVKVDKNTPVGTDEVK